MKSGFKDIFILILGITDESRRDWTQVYNIPLSSEDAANEYQDWFKNHILCLMDLLSILLVLSIVIFNPINALRSNFTKDFVIFDFFITNIIGVF